MLIVMKSPALRVQLNNAQSMRTMHLNLVPSRQAVPVRCNGNGDVVYWLLCFAFAAAVVGLSPNVSRLIPYEIEDHSSRQRRPPFVWRFKL